MAVERAIDGLLPIGGIDQRPTTLGADAGAFDKTAFEWSCYGKLSHAFKRNLRHLFADLDFSGRVEDAPLLEAVTFLQGLLRQGKAPRQTDPSAFPVSIIPTGLRRYLFSAEGNRNQRALEIDRYEFLIYRLLRNALEAGGRVCSVQRRVSSLRR